LLQFFGKMKNDMIRVLNSVRIVKRRYKYLGIEWWFDKACDVVEGPGYFLTNCQYLGELSLHTLDSVQEFIEQLFILGSLRARAYGFILFTARIHIDRLAVNIAKGRANKSKGGLYRERAIGSENVWSAKDLERDKGC
jgi:hypothetical protein